MTLIEPAPTPTEPTNRHRRPIIIAAAAAVLMIVIGAVALATRDDDTTGPITNQPPATSQPPPATQTQDNRSSTDPFNRVWPEGATPRGPVTGELVVSVWASQQGWHFVYADGRLIRTTNSAFGFLEQPLSPEGVDLVRAEIIASGLFNPDRPPPGSELGFQAEFASAGSNLGAIYGDIRARIGDRLVYVPRRPDEEWTSKFDQLSAKLTDLESWLPPSAWADPQQVVYVPSHYAVCMSADELSSIETLLPAAAADLLADARRWTPEPWEQVPDDETQRCFDLTTESARRLAEALHTEIRPNAASGPRSSRFAPDPDDVPALHAARRGRMCLLWNRLSSSPTRSDGAQTWSTPVPAHPTDDDDRPFRVDTANALIEATRALPVRRSRAQPMPNTARRRARAPTSPTCRSRMLAIASAPALLARPAERRTADRSRLGRDVHQPLHQPRQGPAAGCGQCSPARRRVRSGHAARSSPARRGRTPIQLRSRRDAQLSTASRRT